MVSKSIHFLACVIIFLILWISNIPYATFCYPLICWQAFHLFPHFNYCGYCSSEHWHVSIYSSHCLQFFWTSTKNEMVGSYDISMFSFLRKTLNYFPYGFTLYIPTSNVKGFWFFHIIANIFWFFVCFFLCFKIIPACDPMDCSPARLLCPWDSPGRNGDLPDPGINPRSPSLQADSFPLELLWRSISYLLIVVSICICLMTNDVTHLFMHLLAN